jgi:hypothetical protein
MTFFIIYFVESNYDLMINFLNFFSSIRWKYKLPKDQSSPNEGIKSKNLNPFNPNASDIISAIVKYVMATPGTFKLSPVKVVSKYPTA